MSEKIFFYNHNNDHFNIGDFLCTPKHYFNFKLRPEKSNNLQDTLIIGGGTYNRSFGLNYINKYSKPINIGWGLGVTINKNNPHQVNNIREVISEALNIYDICSTRDNDIIKWNEKLLFVPCVSVMNDIIELPAGNKTGIFLNADKKRTNADTIKRYNHFESERLIFCTNAIDELEFRHFFSQTNKIITNSYHVAYWGLLSGRSVAITGYSSKFSSLIKLFNLDESMLLHYNKSDLTKIDNNISAFLKNGDYYQQLVNHRDYISEFRNRNIKFAEILR